MDLGFGSLIEKFEERVGRRPTTVLLYLLGAATLTICVSTIITQGIIPIVDLVRGVSSETARSFFSSLLVGLLIAALAGLVFVGIVRMLLARAIKRAAEYMRRADERMKRADALIDHVAARSDEYTQRLEVLLDAAESATREANERVAELKKLQAKRDGRGRS